MERHVLTDWKTQHRKDVNSPQIYFQMQHNINQNASRNFFIDIGKLNLKLRSKATRIAKAISKTDTNV